MLRIALTGPSVREVADTAATWRDLGGGPDRPCSLREVSWPVDLATAARHHLVVGVTRGIVPATDAVDAWIAPDDASGLWRERVEPFAANLAARRRAPRRRVARLVEPDPSWPAQAQRLIARLRNGAGEQLMRVDHIGSTSVPGLPAKDLVDVQVVVRDLTAARAVAMQAPDVGLVHVAGEWTAPARSGARFREEVLVDADPVRPTNVNLRPVTDPVWRETLLFRDWLRADVRHRDAYLAEKRRLAAATAHVDEYSDGKLGWIGAALGRAEAWAATAGWEL